MKDSQQSMRGVKSRRGNVVQRANIATKQTMDDVEAAGDVEQLIAVVTGKAPVISAELTKLHAELQKYDPKATSELQHVKDAEEAAKRGDSAGVLSSLKGVAKWVRDFAKEVGTSVVAKIIEKQMGA